MSRSSGIQCLSSQKAVAIYYFLCESTGVSYARCVSLPLVLQKLRLQTDLQTIGMKYCLRSGCPTIAEEIVVLLGTIRVLCSRNRRRYF